MMGGAPIGTQERPGAAPAVLALHGFGATPHEVLMVLELAGELGLRALAPLLPGHGTSVAELAKCRWEDWRRAVNESLDRLVLGAQAARAPVIIVGSSMGSLLALELAAERPADVLALALLACPIRLPTPFPSLALQLWCGLGGPDFNLPKATGPDIHDAVQRKTQVTYEAQPCYAGNELRLAGQRLLGHLSEIRCPTFIAHGRRDHVCPVSNARLVYRRLGTPAWDKQLLILPRSYHIITRDIERGVLRGELLQFLARISARARPSSSEQPQTPVEPYPPPALPVSDSCSATSS